MSVQSRSEQAGGGPAAGRDLRALPKGHLHLHFELGMRPTTFAELAAARGVPIPPIRGFSGFAGFTDRVETALALLRTPDDFARLVDELIDDAVADGVTYVEPSFWPYRYPNVFAAPEQAWEVVLERSRAVGAARGVTVRWMAAVDRVRDSPEAAVRIARLALRHAEAGVVGIGLHNDEDGYPPEPFAEAFALATDGGLLSTPHAGELDGPASVRGALDTLRANRLQHGIRVREDPALLDEVIARGVCLDVCPTSNVSLSVVPSLAEHPLPALLAAGVRCSINADDPLLFGPGCLAEYELCRTELGLTDAQLAACARSSIEAGGAPEDVRRRALAGIDAWLAPDGYPTAVPSA
jgi:adenosine deaminase